MNELVNPMGDADREAGLLDPFFIGHCRCEFPLLTKNGFKNQIAFLGAVDKGFLGTIHSGGTTLHPASLSF